MAQARIYNHEVKDSRITGVKPNKLPTQMDCFFKVLTMQTTDVDPGNRKYMPHPRFLSFLFLSLKGFGVYNHSLPRCTFGSDKIKTSKHTKVVIIIGIS